MTGNPRITRALLPAFCTQRKFYDRPNRISRQTPAILL